MTTPTIPPTAIGPGTPCPCGSAVAYGACCGRWHAGPQHLLAPSPEALMRSRYSAYVLGLHDYVRDTWHPRTRPPVIEPDPPGLKWLGLEVRSAPAPAGDEGSVEFVARNKLGGRAQRLHETSRFERIDGRWVYVDGEFRRTPGGSSATSAGG